MKFALILSGIVFACASSADPCLSGQFLVYREVEGVLSRDCETIERKMQPPDGRVKFCKSKVGFSGCRNIIISEAEEAFDVFVSRDGLSVSSCPVSRPVEPMYGLKELDGLILDFLKLKDRARETMIKYRYELSIGTAVIFSGMFYLYRLGIKTHYELSNLRI